MEGSNRRLWIIALVLVVAGVIYFFFGTESGSEARQAIDETAQQVTGQSAVRHGQELEQEIRAITDQRKKELEGVMGERE